MRLLPRSPDPVPPDPSVPPPYDAELFADLLLADPGRALRLLAERPDLVRIAQAVAFGWSIAAIDTLADAGACQKEAL